MDNLRKESPNLY